MSSSTSVAPVVTIGKVRFGNDLPISIIAGPCQLESRQHALEVASALKEIAARLNIGLVYKTSFDKANRTSASAQRGLGLAQSLPIFAEIRSSLGLPVLTDVHDAAQCAGGGAGRGRPGKSPPSCAARPISCSRRPRPARSSNVKKGQFLAPWDMANVVTKITAPAMPTCSSPSAGHRSGTTRWSRTCARCRSWRAPPGAPVIFDATHSVQQPGGKGTSSGGEREFVPVLARAAVAVGRRRRLHRDPS